MRLNYLDLIKQGQKISFKFNKINEYAPSIYFSPKSSIKTKQMLDGLNFILFDHKDLSFDFDTQIEIVDDAENRWIIFRKNNEKEFYLRKNGIKFNFQADLKQFYEMIGFKLEETSLPLFFLNYEKNEFKILTADLVKKMVYFDQMKFDVKLKINQWCQNHFHESVSVDAFVKAAPFLNDIYLMYQSVLSDFYELKKSKKDNYKIDLEFVINLKDQIGIILDLKNQLEKNKDYLQKIDQLYSDLSEIEDHLKTYEQQFSGFKEDDFLKIDIDYIISLLVEKNVYDGLSYKVQQLCDNFEDSLRVYKEIVAKKNEEEKHLISDKIKSFFNKQEDFEKNDFEKFIIGIDNNLEAVKNSFQDKKNILTDKNNMEFKKFLHKKKLPPHFSLEDVANFYFDFFSFFKMSLARKNKLIKIQQIKLELINIASLVSKWQQISSSQKIINTDHLPILITEARNIVRYLEEKVKMYEFLEKNYISLLKDRSLFEYLEKKSTFIQNEWKKIIDHYELLNIKITQKDLKSFINLIQCAHTLEKNFSCEHLNDSIADQNHRINFFQSSFKSSFDFNKLNDFINSHPFFLSPQMIHIFSFEEIQPSEYPKIGKIDVSVQIIEGGKTNNEELPAHSPKMSKKTLEMIKILNGKI